MDRRQLWCRMSSIRATTNATGPTIRVYVNICTRLVESEFCQFISAIATHFFQEGLFDRHDFISNLLDILQERCNAAKPETSASLKLYLPFFMQVCVILVSGTLLFQYMDAVVQNAELSRRCAMIVCKKLGQLSTDHDDSTTTATSSNNIR
jgi:hypothetical protein